MRNSSSTTSSGVPFGMSRFTHPQGCIFMPWPLGLHICNGQPRRSRKASPTQYLLHEYGYIPPVHIDQRTRSLHNGTSTQLIAHAVPSAPRAAHQQISSKTPTHSLQTCSVSNFNRNPQSNSDVRQLKFLPEPLSGSASVGSVGHGCQAYQSTCRSTWKLFREGLISCELGVERVGNPLP